MQLPWLCTEDERDALRRELAGSGPERMLREMGEVLDRIADRRPLLLVTEDLHWSDRATIQLMDYIARRRGSARVMWLASFRLAEVMALEHPLNSLRRELRLHALCTEVVLDAFSESEVADCVATQSRALAEDEGFVHALYDRTDGVPLFVASIMQDLMLRARSDVQASSVVASAVPDNVATIIDHYVARLGRSSTDCSLPRPSVERSFGSRHWQTFLAATRHRSKALARSSLGSESGSRRVMRKNSGRMSRPYAFRHALFRHVLYERTAPLARAQLNGAVGEALERERVAGVPVPAAELAMHFERSQDRLRSLDYYVEAADTALLHLSPAECISLTARALALLEGARARPQFAATELTLWALRGVASFHLLGVTDETRDAFRNAYVLLDEVPDHPMRGLLLHGLGYVHCLRTEFDEALSVAERAIALSASCDDPMILLASCTIQGEVNMLRGCPRVALAWLERGISALDTIEETSGQSFAADPAVTLISMLGPAAAPPGPGRAGSRPHARGPCPRESTGATDGSHGGLVERNTVRVATRQHRACCGAGRGDARGRGRICVGARSNGVPVVQRLGGGSHGCAAGGISTDSRGVRVERATRDARWSERNSRLCCRGLAAQSGLARGAAAARGSEDDRSSVRERVYQPQLSLLEAAIARGRGDDDAAAATLRRALVEARAQESLWLELLALVALSESMHATDAHRARLAALVEHLPEAAGTSAAQRARALLDRAEQG